MPLVVILLMSVGVPEVTRSGGPIDLSEYPESASVALLEMSLAPDAFESALSRSLRPRTWKKLTGTRPLALVAGLQASYHSVSCSLPTTWKKSPFWKLSSWSLAAL